MLVGGGFIPGGTGGGGTALDLATSIQAGDNIQIVALPPPGSNQIEISAVAAGANGQVQFNDNGAFGASSNLVWDDVNARMGIGTATPQGALDVATPGQWAVFRNDVATTPVLPPPVNSGLFLGSGGIGQSEADIGWSGARLRFFDYTTGSAVERLAINSNGRINIWTGIADNSPMLYMSSAYGAMSFGGDYTGFWINSPSYPLVLQTGGVPRITMGAGSSAGLVGIGTTTPQYPLDVRGALADPTGSNGIFTLSAPQTSPTSGLQFGFWDTWPPSAWIQGIPLGMANARLCLNPLGGGVTIGAHSGQAALEVIVPLIGPQDVAHFACAYDPSEEPRLWFGSWNYSGIGAPWECLTFSTNTTGGVWNERMRIDKYGNVGIGTTNPQAALDVIGPGNLGVLDIPTLRLQSPGISGATLQYGDPAWMIMRAPSINVEAAMGFQPNFYLQVRDSTNAAQPLLLQPAGGATSVGNRSFINNATWATFHATNPNNVLSLDQTVGSAIAVFQGNSVTELAILGSQPAIQARISYAPWGGPVPAPLLLNPLGGAVGIAATTPDPVVALEIGGNVIVTGYSGNDSTGGLHLYKGFVDANTSTIESASGLGGIAWPLVIRASVLGLSNWGVTPAVPYSPGPLFHVIVGPGVGSYGGWIDLCGQPGLGSYGGVTFCNANSAAADKRTAKIEGGYTGDPDDDDGYLSFSTAAAGALNERMRIDYLGRVGIGTSLPTATLEVEGSFRIDDQGLGYTFERDSSTGYLVALGSQLGANGYQFDVTTGSPGNVTTTTAMLMFAYGDEVRILLAPSGGAVDIGGDLTVSGDIYAANLAMSDPGPGAGKFWCDPSDGHRVKFAV